MTNSNIENQYDVVVVGAGFSGLYMLHQLRGRGLSVKVIEAGDGIGGTWFWNRYPGARCDIPSLEYSYQFSDELQKEWKWSERYAAQPEILKYLDFVADKFNLRGDIRLNTRVEAAKFDEERNQWSVETSAGETLQAQHLIMATGPLSSPNTPKIDGLASFSGRLFRTSTWPKEGVDFTNRRVGIIGTGSSALQSIPIIAEQAKSLHVFQRTATYAVPAQNHKWDEAGRQKVMEDYAGLRDRGSQNYFGVDLKPPTQSALEASPEERQVKYQECWDEGGFALMFAYYDLALSKGANDTAAEFIRQKIKEKVKDPKVAAALSPEHAVACKRLCLDIGYYETFNRPNVKLVDLKSEPISNITATGVQTATDAYEFDDLILATGFDAMTGAVNKIDIRGTEGISLKQKWEAGPVNYLGLAASGFPNLFLVNGPGSPSVLSNMVPSIEHHVEWISDCIAEAKNRGATRIEASEAAVSAWMEHSSMVVGATIFPSCNSWYLGANVPGKPRVFMPYAGGFPGYVQKCKEVAANGYEGFVFSGAPTHANRAITTQMELTT